MEILGIITLSFGLSLATNIVVKVLRVREHFSMSVRDAALDALVDKWSRCLTGSGKKIKIAEEHGPPGTRGP